MWEPCPLYLSYQYPQSPKEEFVTHMDAISARETITKPNPMNVQMYDQNKPAKPPFWRA
jgi:hypothetical protein